MPAAEGKKLAYWGSDEFPPCGVEPSGTGKQDVFGYDKNGNLVKTGVRDLDEEIQAAAVGVTPYEVFDKCRVTGDLSLLDFQKGEFGDFSGMPETVSDAEKLNQAAAAAASDPETIKALNPAPAAPSASSEAPITEVKQNG